MNKLSKALLLTAIVFLSSNILLSAQTESYRLENGMEVILKESHGSPMIASIIFVKSGSKYESEYENGITHFLEHLLFDGTTSLAREDLDASIRDLGGYLNAFTRKEMTAYLVLLPNQYIDYGLTVQADMLFNSIIPKEELPKERKVVIEEIKRSDDSPGAAAEAFFTEKAYANTPYNRPVLGYEAFINNIPRSAIVEYWKKAYIPSNMTTLVIGDFKIADMKATVQSILGSFDDSTVSMGIATGYDPISEDVGQLTESVIFDTVANVSSLYINFSFSAPTVNQPDYLAVDLLSQYLSMDDISPLMIALKGGAEPLATEASVSLVSYKEFSRLEIQAVANDPTKRDEIVATILDHVKNSADLAANPEILEGIKISNNSQEIYMSEKLHYLGFMIAPMMMTGGWEFIESYGENLSATSWDDCMEAAQKWFRDPKYVATVVSPQAEGKTGYQPSVMTVEDVTSYFSVGKQPNYDLVSRPAITYPSTENIDYQIVDPATYHREDLANGMTVIIKSSPGCRLMAMNVLGKNRTVNEPDGKEGLTDFVNRMIEQGTVTRNGAELTRDLARIGANVTLYDNPWIPYDDRYTTRRFSFMKFETIDQYAEKGFHLFSEMLLYPAFDSTDIENVRQSMMGIVRRADGSAGKVARNLFYQTMFGDSRFGRAIGGTAESVAEITRTDLIEHHHNYYSPENIILTIATGRPIPEVMDWVDSRFGRLTSVGFSSEIPQVPTAPLGLVTAHKEMDKEQISVYIGGPLLNVDDSERAALTVATSILSTRLYLNLREKQGLAYSIGASQKFDRDFGWYYCSIGTGFENYQKALDGMDLEIQKLTFDGPTPAEIKKVRNQIWGRLMSTKLSSINQAYYLGLNELMGNSLAHDKEYLTRLQAVDANAVRRVCSKYFRTGDAVLTTAGKRTEK